MDPGRPPKYTLSLLTAQPLLLDDNAAAGEIDIEGMQKHLEKVLAATKKGMQCCHEHASVGGLGKISAQGSTIVHLLMHGSKVEDILTLENTSRVGFAEDIPKENAFELFETMKDTMLFVVYSKHADLAASLLFDLGIPNVIGFKYLYGGKDAAGLEFIELFYDSLFSGGTIANSFQVASNEILRKYKADSTISDRIFFFSNGMDIQLNLRRGKPNWNIPPSKNFIPEPRQAVLGFNQVMTEIMDSVLSGTSITWVHGRRGCGKTSLALHVCKYLAERDYILDGPMPIVYVDWEDHADILNAEKKIRDRCNSRENLFLDDSTTLIEEMGKLLNYVGKEQERFCSQLATVKNELKRKKTEIEIQGKHITRYERNLQTILETGKLFDGVDDEDMMREKIEYAKEQLKEIYEENQMWLRKLAELEDASENMDFALSPFESSRKTKLFTTLSKKYRLPWLIVLDGFNEKTGWLHEASIKKVENFLTGMINGNQHVRLMICTNATIEDLRRMLPRPVRGAFTQKHFNVPMFGTSTKIDLFLKYRPQNILRQEFGDISRAQIKEIMQRSAIINSILPAMTNAEGIITLSRGLQDTMLCAVDREAMGQAVFCRDAFEELKHTGSLPNLVYSDSNVADQGTWHIFVHPLNKESVVVVQPLFSVKLFASDGTETDFIPADKPTMSEDLKKNLFPDVSKIGVITLTEKIDELSGIMLDGQLICQHITFSNIYLRSPMKVLYKFDIPWAGKHVLSKHRVDFVEKYIPDENVLFDDNLEYSAYWEAQIFPTLPAEISGLAYEKFQQSISPGDTQSTLPTLTSSQDVEEVGDTQEVEEVEDTKETVEAAKHVSEWTAEEVSDFFANMAQAPEFQTYAQAILDNGITGDILEDVADDGMLQELGVARKLHRKVILSKLTTLLGK